MSAGSSFRSADISSAETLQASYDSNRNQMFAEQGNNATSIVVLNMLVDSNLRVSKLSVMNSLSRAPTPVQQLHIEDTIAAVDGILVKGLDTAELEERLSKSSVILRVLRGPISVYVSCNLKRIQITPETRMQNSARDSNIAGIGITLQRNAVNNQVQISYIHPDGPASQIADIEVGDRVIAVGMQKVDELQIEDIRQLIIGPEGTDIELKLERQPPPPRQVKYKFRVRIRRALLFNSDSPTDPNASGLPSTIDLAEQKYRHENSFERNITLQYIVSFCQEGNASNPQQRTPTQMQFSNSPNRKLAKRTRNKIEKGKISSDFLPAEPVRFYATDSSRGESSTEESMGQEARTDTDSYSRRGASEWDMLSPDMEQEFFNLSSSMQSISSLQHSEEIFWPNGRSVLFADRRLDPGLYDSDEDDGVQEDLPAIEESLDLQWVQVEQDQSRPAGAFQVPPASDQLFQESKFYSQPPSLEVRLSENDGNGYPSREHAIEHAIFDGKSDETLEKVMDLLQRMQAKFQDIDDLTRRVKGASKSLPM
eukprot:762997-Hanusia_phi.AAC.7